MPIFKTEKEFEDQFCDYITANGVNPLNHRKVLDFVRQPTLGEYGIADIVTIEDDGGKTVINVIEMKNTPFQASMIFQIGRYLEAIKIGADYRVLMPDLLKLNWFEPEEIESENAIMFPDVPVIGSLVCVGCSELTKGIASVFNQMNVTVYNAEIEMLEVVFSQMNSKSDYDTNQIGKIHTAIEILSHQLSGGEA